MSFYGCCCDPHTSQVCGSVAGLCPGQSANGIVLSVTGPGGFSGSHTLSGGATSFCWTGLAYGSYTVSISGLPTGYNTPSPITVTVSAGTPSATAAFVLTLATGWSCTPPTCGRTTTCSGPPYFLSPPWSSIFLNDGFGTITLAYTGSAGLYAGGATRTAASDCNGATSVPVTVSFQVQCTDSTWTVAAGIYACTISGGGGPTYKFPGATAPLTYLSSSSSTGSPACPPSATSGGASWTGYSTGAGTDVADGLSRVYGTVVVGPFLNLNLVVSFTS